MLNIYKASAGSGKTHVLTGEYISEAFASQAPDKISTDSSEIFNDTAAFSRILAVTFTNKAAGEMKERILRELENLSKNSQSVYVEDICKKYPQFTPQKVSLRAKQILSAVLHNYSDFNLKTIDSFVQRILRAFCYDININSGFSTQTDESVVLTDLIDMLFKLSDEDISLRNQLLLMAEKNVKDGQNWDFRAQVEEVAKLIFTERFKDLEKIQAEMPEDEKKDYFKKSLELVNLIYSDYLEKAEDISKRAAEEIENISNLYGINSTKEFGRDVEICCNFLTKKLDGAAVSKTVQKMIESDNWLTKKPTLIQKDSVPVLQKKLIPLLEEAVSLIENSALDFITAKIIRKDFYAFMLIGDIARLLPEYRKENRTIMISDGPAFLNSVIAGNDAPFIFERVGNKFDHIFIDEFQDTSLFQWNCFKPLIENALAQGFNNMIVGDVKQSVYRFRGGDWSLLNSGVQSQIGKESINIKTLDVNWRSKKNIVNFNDAVFSKAVRMLENFSGEELDFSLLEDIYSDSYQNLPQNKDRSGGKTQVVFIPVKGKKKSESENDENDEEHLENENLLIPDLPASEFQTKALNRMANEIDSLLKLGVKPKKICVLVRKKTEAALIVKFLLQYQRQVSGAEGYDVISGDSLYIANSLPVKLVVNTMKYILNPEDCFAKAEMMRTYCLVNSLDIQDDEIFKAVNAEKSFMPEGFDRISETYSDLPLFDLVEKIIAFYSLERFSGDAEYLRTFEDCVLSFTQMYSSDLNRFVDWWDKTGVKTAVQPSESQDAVNVMTVHKSKGLDFSIQFVPFCDWDMEETSGLRSNYIWVKCPEQSKFKSLPILPVKYSKDLLKSYFKDYYLEEKRNMYVDSLNLLYVALTRAVDQLHIYAPYSQDKQKISTVGDLLYMCINQDDVAETKNPVIKLSDYYDQDSKTLLIDENHKIELDGFKIKSKGFELSSYKNSPWEEKIAVKSNFADFFIKQNPFLQEKINYGLFMHDVFSRIEYQEDYPEVLSEMKFQGRITEAQQKELSLKLEEAFKNPQVKSWFSKTWTKVYTESALLTLEGAIRIPDRVLSNENDTVVIDFKFGSEHEQYKEQILEYAALLKQMGFPNVKSYLYYVEQSKIVEFSQ